MISSFVVDNQTGVHTSNNYTVLKKEESTNCEFFNPKMWKKSTILIKMMYVAFVLEGCVYIAYGNISHKLVIFRTENSDDVTSRDCRV